MTFPSFAPEAEEWRYRCLDKGFVFALFAI